MFYEMNKVNDIRRKYLILDIAGDILDAGAIMPLVKYVIL